MPTSQKEELWDIRFIELSETVATWSKDPSSKVGAVIVRPDRTVSSVGYNGFPRGISDSLARLDDRSTKYSLTVHAEMNAILNSHDASLTGYSLYVSPLMCCDRCALHIVQAGITRVVARKAKPELAERWAEQNRAARNIFREARVSFKEYE